MYVAILYGSGRWREKGATHSLTRILPPASHPHPPLGPPPPSRWFRPADSCPASPTFPSGEPCEHLFTHALYAARVAARDGESSLLLLLLLLSPALGDAYRDDGEGGTVLFMLFSAPHTPQSPLPQTPPPPPPMTVPPSRRAGEKPSWSLVTATTAPGVLGWKVRDASAASAAKFLPERPRCCVQFVVGLCVSCVVWRGGGTSARSE